MAVPHPIPTHFNFKNLTGLRSGRLVVESFAGRRGDKAMWNCRCDCGNETCVVSNGITTERTRSCGCLRNEKTAERSRTQNRKHGMWNTREYRAWRGMRERCERPKHPAYKDYGGRGITVCERWQSFDNFIEDMGRCPPGHSIDREDNDKGYEPGNCRWTTATVQSRNKRSNRLITYQGRTQCVADWADEVGLPRSLLQHRVAAGWSAEKALTTPFVPAAERWRYHRDEP